MWKWAMQNLDTLSSAELGALIQRLYLHLEQYEIHAAALREGSFEREGANAVAQRMRKKLIDGCALLDRRTGESMGLDARTQAARTPVGTPWPHIG
jgi:hypothetical protein